MLNYNDKNFNPELLCHLKWQKLEIIIFVFPDLKINSIYWCMLWKILYFRGGDKKSKKKKKSLVKQILYSHIKIVFYIFKHNTIYSEKDLH